MNRRNFFRMLTGAVVAPVLAPLAKLLPAPAMYTTYLLGDEQLIHLDSSIQETARVYYSSSLMASLKANADFPSMGMFKPLPENTGKHIQFFTYPLDKSKEV